MLGVAYTTVTMVVGVSSESDLQVVSSATYAPHQTAAKAPVVVHDTAIPGLPNHCSQQSIHQSQT